MFSRRGLASVAAAYAKPNPLIEPIQQKTSRLPNGMTISSVDLQVVMILFIRLLCTINLDYLIIFAEFLF